MGNSRKLVTAIIFTLMGFASFAQSRADLRQANRRLNSSQESISKALNRLSLDNNEKSVLSGFLSQTDSLQKAIMNDKNLSIAQKVQALNCQCYLYDTLQSDIKKNSFDASLLIESRDNFIPVWQMLSGQNQNMNLLANSDAKTAGVLAVAFKDYPQAARIRDIADLKTLERNPEGIMNFLANNHNYRLRDSLVFIYGNTLPEKLISYTKTSRNAELVRIIKENNSPLVQTLLSISNEKNLDNYLPFVGMIAEKKITLAEIDQLRAEPSKYYKQIVDLEMANHQKFLSGQTPLYFIPTKFYLKKYAKMFFTDVVNSLHEEPTEKARYFVFDEMRPQDLYFVITTGETELYTSSYLYTYKKLMSKFEKDRYDALFDLVKYDQYRKFLLMAGRYNTVTSFLKQMPQQSSIDIVKRLIAGLDASANASLEDIINVAETFPGISKDEYLAELAAQEIKYNYDRAAGSSNRSGMKVYKLLSDIFNVVKNEESDNKSALPAFFTAYYKVPHTSLRERDGSINELVLFFGDDDGKSSFTSFLAAYSDASQWTIEKNPEWVKITSKKKHPISIYANVPLNNDEGLDLKAQETLSQHLKDKGIEPRILVMRGHSYHMINSFKFFTPSIRLGILGSCGGYREIKEILGKSAQAQVVSSKQIGSKQINDPMLKLINNKLLNGQDLDWVSIWGDLEKQFKPNKQLYDYFEEYVPPYKNIALLVTTLYNKSGLK
jgi:hypothetical protein